jgi:hypothetical protein
VIRDRKIQTSDWLPSFGQSTFWKNRRKFGKVLENLDNFENPGNLKKNPGQFGKIFESASKVVFEATSRSIYVKIVWNQLEVVAVDYSINS